jgi:chromosome segregation ATPase
MENITPAQFYGAVGTAFVLLLTVLGFLLRVLVKNTIGTLHTRLTRIDGGDDPTRGKLHELEQSIEELEEAPELTNRLRETIKEAKTLNKSLTNLRESLPKEYVLKVDYKEGRESIEKHLQTLAEKVDSVLTYLAGIRGKD